MLPWNDVTLVFYSSAGITSSCIFILNNLITWCCQKITHFTQLCINNPCVLFPTEFWQLSVWQQSADPRYRTDHWSGVPHRQPYPGICANQSSGTTKQMDTNHLLMTEYTPAQNVTQKMLCYFSWTLNLTDHCQKKTFTFIWWNARYLLVCKVDIKSSQWYLKYPWHIICIR